MPKFTINGVEIEAKEGQTVLKAALEHGIYIPHLCYHPYLKVAGNCRMCLVEIEKMPKLQIACATEAREGMVVLTMSEKVIKARKAVLEFLLINHPLDCPVCDQCGECKLQDYCFQYGQETSRFQEEKRSYPKIAVGDNIVRDMNRCIHCTRCIRFLRDVAGQEEFTLYERGGKTQVGPYRENSLQTPFSLNLADVCPVGALTSRHFRFQARSWLMQKVRTLCAACSRGCNVYAWISKGKVLRLTPAVNESVNMSWMCDFGHRSIQPSNDGQPGLIPLSGGRQVELTESLGEVASKLSHYIHAGDGSRVGVIASTCLTNEDLYMLRKLAREVLGTSLIAWIPGTQDEAPFGPLDEPLDTWFVRKDKTPNARGAQNILGSTEHAESVESVLQAAEQGELKALLVFGEDLAARYDAGRIKQIVPKLDLFLVVDARMTRSGQWAHVFIPDAVWLEKDATFTNEVGRVQRLRPVVDRELPIRAAFGTIQEIVKLVGVNWYFASPAEVMEEIAVKVPGYQEISYPLLDETGLLVEMK